LIIQILNKIKIFRFGSKGSFRFLAEILELGAPLLHKLKLKFKKKLTSIEVKEREGNRVHL